MSCVFFFLIPFVSVFIWNVQSLFSIRMLFVTFQKCEPRTKMWTKEHSHQERNMIGVFFFIPKGWVTPSLCSQIGTCCQGNTRNAISGPARCSTGFIVHGCGEGWKGALSCDQRRNPLGFYSEPVKRQENSASLLKCCFKWSEKRSGKGHTILCTVAYIWFEHALIDFRNHSFTFYVHQQYIKKASPASTKLPPQVSRRWLLVSIA